MAAPQAPPPPQPVVQQRSLVERVLRDPNAIWMREMRQSARLGRTPWVIFAITLSVSLLMCSIGGLAAASQTSPAKIGGALFQIFFSIAYAVVAIGGPTVAANSIASEREGRTWEAVLLTGLTPKKIARGKFMAAYTTTGLYIVVLAPVGALSFLFGGVTATEVAVAFVFLFLLAALGVAFGLAVSSLMSSLRGAIVVTLMLAIIIGPLLYFIFGYTCSYGVHKLWSEVPEGLPIWLPLAYSRADFGAEYILFLIVLPILTVAIPAWFLYEVTVANLTGDADDRSTGLKRWFTVATPLLSLGCAMPSLLAPDDDGRIALSIIGTCVFIIHLSFAAMLFASEPPGPSRRVRVHWQRDATGALRRFFGPGLTKTTLLVVLFGIVGILVIAGIDMIGLQISGTGLHKDRYIQEIFVFALYSAPFYVFFVGLVSWLRARGNTPWIARLIATAVLFLVIAGPWIVAAIGGVLARHHGDEWIVIASPSPFYAFFMLSWLEKSSHTTSVPVIEAGITCALLWGLGGLGLVAASARRASRVVAQHDAAVAQAEAALRAEEYAAQMAMAAAQAAEGAGTAAAGS